MDLRDWLQVAVRIRNEGSASATPRARLESRGRASDWVSSAKPLAPGAEQDLTLPFAGPMAVLGATGEPRSGGSSFESDCATGVRFSAAGDGELTLRVTSVRALVPPAPELPDWLGSACRCPANGRRPSPRTSTALSWMRQSGPSTTPTTGTSAHFSKDNVILGDGLLRLRFERKRGHADDDPNKPETDWATGFLTSIGKFRQLYGYFECRLKLPTAPGLWPAFWMMPDRGDVPDRESTADGGMEFDILEYLTRYGPYRYNLAYHWDNYGKDHKSNGTVRIYFQPDKDGFVTAGLLWEPGRATFYQNGIPVAQWTVERVSSVPQYILFTAVSGGWGGNDLTGEGLPDDFVLDYVRAWQLPGHAPKERTAPMPPNPPPDTLAADSPVQFPADGPVPAKYPPDLPAKDGLSPEEGYYLFSTPERSLDQIRTIQAEMPAGQFTAPAQDWANLPRTRRILTEGGELRILGLGDSIVNDTMRSGWVGLLQEAYPKATIRGTVYVRGAAAAGTIRKRGASRRWSCPSSPTSFTSGASASRTSRAFGRSSRGCAPLCRRLSSSWPQAPSATPTRGAPRPSRRPPTRAPAPGARSSRHSRPSSAAPTWT